MAVLTPECKKKPTHTYYRAEFSGSIAPRWETLEKHRHVQGWPENGEWMNEDGAVLHRVCDRVAYEAIWAVPIGAS